MKRKRKYGPKTDVEKIKELYMQDYSIVPIATMLGIGKSTVSFHVKRLGISRTKSEAGQLASKMGKFRNRKAENHPNWKGGQPKPRNGYIFIYAPEHPRASPEKPYVQEHILVWEKAHNRPLPNDYVIHHINGIRNDNRPRNLLALPKGKHHGKMLELELKKRIRELEAEAKLVERAFDEHQAIFRISEN